MKYVSPEPKSDAYTCPHCGVLAQQHPIEVYTTRWSQSVDLQMQMAARQCGHCAGYTVWHSGRQVFPDRGNAPLPNPDTPADVIALYEEAAGIMVKSPRAAAALLRLAVQKLCKALGEKGKDINDDIGNLVKQGLPIQVQQSLDAVRVIGNNAVHPGEINADNPAAVALLFGLLNVIVDRMITQPKKIQEIYGALPPKILDGISKRDGKKE
jgi:hypothetical protein